MTQTASDSTRTPRDKMIHSTSNCIYTGMRLERYELMLKVRAEEGVYA